MAERSEWTSAEGIGMPGQPGQPTDRNASPDTPWSEQDADDLARACSDPVCPECGGELGVVCLKTVHPDQPFPCRCQGTPREGMCECDIYVCFSCKYRATAAERARSIDMTKEMRKEFTIYLPPGCFGREG